MTCLRQSIAGQYHAQVFVICQNKNVQSTGNQICYPKNHLMRQFAIRRSQNTIDKYEICVDYNWPKLRNFHNLMNFGAFPVNFDLNECSYFLVSQNQGY